MFIILLLFSYSLAISKGCVIEFSYIEKGVSIQENCILSNLHIPVSLLKLHFKLLNKFLFTMQANSVVPPHSYLHTVAVTMDNKLMYSTFAFGKPCITKRLANQIIKSITVKNV